MRIPVGAWWRRLGASRILAAAFLALSFIFFYLWHLGKLTAGLSPSEAAARASSSSLHNIINNPLNLPHKLLQYAAQKVGYHEAFSMRFSSVIIAALLLWAIFWLMRSWFGVTAGLASAIIFATTPLVILLGRNASADVMLLIPAALLALYVRLSRHENAPRWPWLVLVLVSALALYTPGMIWIILVVAIFRRKRLFQLAAKLPRNILWTSLGLSVLLLIPLAWGLVKNIQLYHQLLLIPRHWAAPLVIAKSIGWSALALFWRTPHFNPLIVGRLPILNIIQICLIIFGVYVMYSRARREMIYISAVTCFSIVASGINDNILLLAIGLPGLAILGGAGLRYLYVEWRSIFPKNPIALSIALVLIAAIVGLQMAYGYRYTLVAWPHTPLTKQLYVLK